MQFFANACYYAGRLRRAWRDSGIITKTTKSGMRLTAILLVAAVIQTSAKGTAQTVTYSARSAPITQIFSVIKKQTGYVFVYRNEDVKQAKNVSIDVKEEPLENVLDMILRDQPLKYTMEGNTIVISIKETRLSIGAAMPGAPPVKGVTRDQDGNPLRGVNVVVKGTKRGVTTDADGRFSLELEGNDILVFSSIGFVPKEVKIESATAPLIIVLQKSVSQLDEVQYIAYGTQTKRFSVGNVTSVKAADLEKQPVNNPLLALQGRVPGLTVVQSTGTAGSAVTVRVQGRSNLSSFLAGSDPLIIIDGVPYPSQNLLTFQSGLYGSGVLGPATGRFSGSGSTLSLMNLDDIESIDVLKDADATAIYGSRAANGAILITTKKGKSGDTKVEFGVQTGWGRVAHKWDLLNSTQYMEMRQEAKHNSGEPVLPTDYDLNGLWDTTHYTDWQKELIGNTAKYNKASISFKGGNSNINYLVGATYNHETTVFPGNFENRQGAIHFNLNTLSNNKKFRMQLSGNFVAGKNIPPGVDFTEQIALPPVAPSLYNNDGSLNWAPDSMGISSWVNPLSYTNNIFETKSVNIIGNALFSYELLPNLDAKVSLGYNSLQQDQFLAALDQSVAPEWRSTRFRSANFTDNSTRSWIIEPQINYNLKIGENSSLNILLGSTFQQNVSDGKSIVSFGQSSDQLLRMMSSGTTSAYAINYEYRYNAIFGRVNFIHKDRYVINLSARGDGSSRFGSNNLFHNFGAIGGAWILSEENFLKDKMPWLSFAKLRASYGLTGNDQIDDYLFLSLFSSTFFTLPYQTVFGLQSTGVSNPSLQWEETKKLQGGLDLGFVRDRILISLTYFQNRTSNSLTTVNLPFTTGTGGFVDNFPALIQNSGVELSLSSENIKTKQFSWNTNLNLTLPRSKLVKFPGLESSSVANDLVIGQPLDIQKSYKFHSIDPQTGQYLYLNAEDKITPDLDFVKDRFVILNLTQRFYGGFKNTFSYRGLQLDFLLQFVQQKGTYFSEIEIAGYPNRFFKAANQPLTVLKRWQKPGDITDIPPYTTNISSRVPGDRLFKDASFARMKNVSLSYQFPRSFCSKLRLDNGKVFVNGQNLFTITNHEGLDPETQSITTLPPLRVVMVGIQVTLK